MVNYSSVDVDGRLKVTIYALEQFQLQDEICVNCFCPCDIGLQPMDYFIGVPRDFV